MALIVQKFGGSSVKDRNRIFNVARIVANTHKAGNDVVVVVSAQGDTTDDLIAKAAEITHNPSAREMDMLLAAGEEISIALLAMALNELGCHATSLTGWQAGFRTDRAYTKARITRMETERISSELERNRVVVVAGFQGLNKLDDITTLGRGGSDTSAVALAAALHADRCQIFTDVEGVYTADPRKVRNTRKLDEITFDEMLELVLSTHAAVEKAPRTFDADAHHKLARRAAAESIVLLRNEGGILPLKPNEKLAVIGDFAETPRYQGAGSSAVNALQVDTLLDSIKADDSGITFVGYASGFERQGAADAEKLEEAVALAKKADTVLLCLGLDELRESEGLDRSDMKLAENQQQLLAAVAAVNPNVVVLLSAGAPVETPWVGQCRALVYGALGGQAGAGAAADILTGKLCPCGKLSQTWAQAHDDTPAKANFGGEGRNVEYREGLYVGYRYYQTAGVPVAFPFGHGLSYTQFVYSDLHADAHSATLTVTNTGDRAGAEIVQLYVAKPNAEIFRPAQELKAFAKVQLAAGESKTVTLTLDDKAFRYWNTRTDSWEVEGGTYELRVGASSADIRLTAAVEVIGTDALNPYAGKALPHYQSGKVQTVPDAEWETLLGRPIPDDRVKIDRNMTLGELNHGRSPLGWLVWAVMTALLNASYKKGKPDLNVLFQYNMPLRALAKMTNGAISMGMVDGIVMEVQGFWVIGLVRVIFEAVKNVILNAQLENRLRNS